MKLSEVLPTVIALLGADPFLATLETVSSPGADFNQRVETALRERGLALVVVLTAGSAKDPKAPRLKLESEVLVSVLENPAKNATGRAALDVVEAVLGCLHQARWPAQRGIQNEVTVDTPAFEAGPLGGGLVTFFCRLRVVSIQPVPPPV